MSYLPKCTNENFSLTSPIHQAAIKKGSDHFYDYPNHNVIDEFKGKSREEIKDILKQTANPFAILIENFVGDFNISSAIRNANAFNAQEVYYIGNKRFDRRGSCGCYHYMDINWLSTTDELLSLKSKYRFVGVDNIKGAKSLRSYKYQKNSLFIFGEEGCGLTPKMQELCDDLIYIEQYGSVRSLNCAVASGIIMFDFLKEINK